MSDDDSICPKGFPIIPECDPKAIMRRLLETAVATCAGVAVVAVKGVGKSFAVQRLCDEWDGSELERSLNDSSYVPRRVVLIARLKATDERECLTDILTAIRNGVPPNLRVRGGRKSNTQIRGEIVSLLLESNAVALVIEEGEFLEHAGMVVLRDLMAEAAEKDRRQQGSQQAGVARGIGVFVVGTPHVRRLIAKTNEARHRWILVEELGLVSPELVPDIYLRWFPLFRLRVEHTTAEQWKTYILTVVTLGRPLAIGLLIRHAQLYLEVLRGGSPDVDRTTAKFFAEFFEATWGRGDDLGEAA